MNNFIPTLKYMSLTMVHKWYVFLAGLKTGAPIWRLIIHDWSKFTPAEAPALSYKFGEDVASYMVREG